MASPEHTQTGLRPCAAVPKAQPSTHGDGVPNHIFEHRAHHLVHARAAQRVERILSTSSPDCALVDPARDRDLNLNRVSAGVHRQVPVQREAGEHGAVAHQGTGASRGAGSGGAGPRIRVQVLLASSQ